MKKFNKKEFSRLIVGKKIMQIRNVVCGEFLGGGMFRDVHVYKQNPNYVVKIERDPSRGQFANATEWRHYIDNREWKFLSEWLAPCELITETGQVLIQRRIEHRRRKEYPKYIPCMFTDTKLRNFGWITGTDKFVCCDYTYIPLAFVKVGGKKMKYAKWWGTLK